MKGRRTFIPIEAAETKAWRLYAEPYNKHLAERTKGSVWLDDSIKMKVAPKVKI